MADTKADTEPAANQSGVNANEGAGRGNHCRSSGERVVENRVGLDSLTAMVAYLRPHFFELPKKINFSANFCRLSLPRVTPTS